MAKTLITTIISILAFFGGVTTLSAATLGMYPTSGKHPVGTTFPVTFYVETPDQDINAVSGVVSFPIDALEVVSISKLDSVISLWVQEPSFSNSKGSINFEGIILNPGYKGSLGKILTAYVRVKKEGTGSMSFASGSVLANDGTGTNVLYKISSSEYALTPKPAPVATTSEKKNLAEKLDETFAVTGNTPPTSESPQYVPEAVPEVPAEVMPFSLTYLLLLGVVGLNLYILYRFLGIAHRLHTTRTPDAPRGTLTILRKYRTSFKRAKTHRKLTHEEENFLKDVQEL